MKTSMENYEERFFDYMEGALNPDEMKEVEAFVASHPELESDFKYCLATKLKPDHTLVFEHKEALTHPVAKKATVIPLFAKIASLAAAIAVLLTIGWFFLHKEQQPTREPVPLIASLPPIQAQSIDSPPLNTQLAKTRLKKVQKHTPTHLTEPAREVTVSEKITTLEPVRPRQLTLNETLLYAETELQASLISMPIVTEERSLPEEEGFFDNALKFSRSILKQTAKTFLTAYYTADCYIEEAKERIWE